MKRMLSILIMIVMLSLFAISALAAAPTTEPTVPAATGAYTTSGSDSTYANKQMTILVYSGAAPSVAEDSIKYIDQMPSNANGIYSFSYVVDMPTAVTGAYTVLIGGETLTTPISAGTIDVSASGVDKTLLVTAIADAETTINSYTVGTAVGNVPQAAKDTFQAAITAATAVNTSVASTQAEVDAQVTAVASAKTAFLATVITSSTYTITGSIAVTTGCKLPQDAVITVYKYNTVSGDETSSYNSTAVTLATGVTSTITLKSGSTVEATYEIKGLEADSKYRIEFKKAFFVKLSKGVIISPTGAASTINTKTTPNTTKAIDGNVIAKKTLYPGDATNDNSTSMSDFNKFKQYLGKNSTNSPTFTTVEYVADFNQDNSISMADFNQFKQGLGKNVASYDIYQAD